VEQVVVEITPTVAGKETRDGDDKTKDVDPTKVQDGVEVLREIKTGELPPGDAKGSGIDNKEGGTKKTQKKLSRAERRRQIKEEIQKLAQGNRRGIYQPRLW
jgi:hypothetical protein